MYLGNFRSPPTKLTLPLSVVGSWAELGEYQTALHEQNQEILALDHRTVDLDALMDL